MCQVEYPVCIDEGTLSLISTPSPGPVGCAQEVFGPQTFGPAIPGTEAIAPCLESKNKQVEKQLFDAAEAYYKQGDFRWFFTFTHAKITQLINTNLAAFQRPNALIRLNVHFAEAFLRAIGGRSHEDWRKAFLFCQAVQESNSLLLGWIEWCGAEMAHVHIHIDLSNAIREVGCIPPGDYSNTLVFVNSGAKAAVVKLSGRLIGAAKTRIQDFLQPLLKLEVKVWRNAVYEGICNSALPSIENDFAKRVKL
jgi:hypothetical protein